MLAQAAVLFTGTALLPVLAAAGLLWMAMPLGDVLRGLAGSWKWVGDPQLSRLTYFRALMGTLDTADSLTRMAAWSAGYLLIFGSALIVGWLTRDRVKVRWAAGILAAVAMLGVWIFGPGASEARLGLFQFVPIPLRQAWETFASPLPLIMTAAGVVLLVRVLRARDAHQRHTDALRLMLTVFAGAMLGRMLLNATVMHYGFALAMPAMGVAVALLVGWLPNWLDARGRGGWVVRAVALAVLGFVIVLHVQITMSNVGSKVIAVARGSDLFMADGRGAVVNAVVLDLKANLSPDQTLLAAPEGLIINYLARRKTPSPHLNFTPPALIMYGEQRMLRDLQANPPDYILLVHVETPEYDSRFFGYDYAQALATWMEENYHRVQLYGSEPFFAGHFGMLVLRRNP
jgi:hypothetical protein